MIWKMPMVVPSLVVLRYESDGKGRTCVILH